MTLIIGQFENYAMETINMSYVLQKIERETLKLG